MTELRAVISPNAPHPFLAVRLHRFPIVPFAEQSLRGILIVDREFRATLPEFARPRSYFTLQPSFPEHDNRIKYGPITVGMAFD